MNKIYSTLKQKVYPYFFFCFIIFLLLSLPAKKVEAADYDTLVTAFINDGRFSNGTFWGYNQTPKVSTWSSIGCCAYVNDFAKYVHGLDSCKYGTEFTNLSEVQAGDVLYGIGGAAGEHWIAVLYRNGNTLYTAEGNFASKVRISTTGYTISGNKFYGPKDIFTFDHGYHYNIDRGNNPFGFIDSVTAGEGYIDVKGWVFDLDAVSSSTNVHIYIGGGIGTDNIEGYSIEANVSRKDVDNVYHVGEFHGFETRIYTKKSGKQPVYIYGINVVSGGNVELGHTTVTITKDTKQPAISDVKIYNITKNGYTVSCNVTDNVQVDRVQFPSWTELNDQDDIQKDWGTNPSATGTKSGNTYTYEVKIADHNNERGRYHTHIYAYDKAGNYTAYRATDNTIVPEKVVVTPIATPEPTAAPVITPVPTVEPDTTKEDSSNNNSQEETEAITKPEKVSLYSPYSLLKKRMTVFWSWVTDADGYELEYATNKSFTSSTKVTIAKRWKTSKTSNKLTSKKKYYVRVRAYKLVDGKKVYGEWSSTKSCKVK